MTALRLSFTQIALAAALASTFSAQAQTAPAASAAAQAPLPAPDAEKQKIIDRILLVFHPEVGVLQAVQRPALDAMQQSNIALQTAHVPAEKKEKTLKDISTDVQKYIDTTTPIAVASAKKQTNPSVGPILAKNFTVEELRQLEAMLESPLKAKFEKLVPEMETAVGRKVQADIAAQVNQNVKTMTEAVGTKLRVAATVQ
jgi:uncharacterized protein